MVSMKTFAIFIKDPDGKERFNNTEEAENKEAMLKLLEIYDKGQYVFYEIDPAGVDQIKRTFDFRPLDVGTIGFGAH
jgi:hypothetical protein